MSLVARVSLVSLAAVLALLAAAPARAAVKDAYCSPSGDFCEGVEPKKPRVTLGIHTFSFRGRYRLCTRFATEKGYSCRTFRLRAERNGVYGFSVRWQRYFPHQRRGRYFAKWKKAGSQLGPIIWFRW